VLVYDLGLTPAQRWEAARWCGASLPWLPGALGRLAAVAPHVGALQQYAWKPLALADALRRHAAVLWLDAGNTVRAPPALPGPGAGVRRLRAAAAPGCMPAGARSVALAGTPAARRACAASAGSCTGAGYRRAMNPFVRGSAGDAAQQGKALPGVPQARSRRRARSRPPGQHSVSVRGHWAVCISLR
jgi:hypothetical protein